MKVEYKKMIIRIELTKTLSFALGELGLLGGTVTEIEVLDNAKVCIHEGETNSLFKVWEGTVKKYTEKGWVSVS